MWLARPFQREATHAYSPRVGPQPFERLSLPRAHEIAHYIKAHSISDKKRLQDVKEMEEKVDNKKNKRLFVFEKRSLLTMSDEMVNEIEELLTADEDESSLDGDDEKESERYEYVGIVNRSHHFR